MVLPSTAFGQTSDAETLLKELSNIRDQNRKPFDPNKIKNNYTFIFIEGTNTITVDVYSKLSGKRPAGNVQIIGGWKNVIPGMDPEKKFNHLKDIFAKVSYPILIDVESKVLGLLELNQFSIVTVSGEDGKLDIIDFGSDRAAFLPEFYKYLEEISSQK